MRLVKPWPSVVSIVGLKILSTTLTACMNVLTMLMNAVRHGRYGESSLNFPLGVGSSVDAL